MPDYTYTDESTLGGKEQQQQQGNEQSGQESDPQREPKQQKQGGNNKSDDKPKGPLRQTTKELGDLLAGDKGLLGEEGLVGGLLESLLGEEGLVGGLLGGKSSDKE